MNSRMSDTDASGSIRPTQGRARPSREHRRAPSVAYIAPIVTCLEWHVLSLRMELFRLQYLQQRNISGSFSSYYCRSVYVPPYPIRIHPQARSTWYQNGARTRRRALFSNPLRPLSVNIQAFAMLTVGFHSLYTVSKIAERNSLS